VCGTARCSSRRNCSGLSARTTLTLPLGARRNFRIVDGWHALTKTARESKLGYQGAVPTRRAAIIVQIEKNAYLRAKGTIDTLEWRFFPSDISGTVGAHPEIIDALIANDIPYYIHLPVSPTL
jgi:hypothetical protein